MRFHRPVSAAFRLAPGLGIVLLFLACTTPPASDRAGRHPILGGPGDFLPMEDGTRWSYEVVDGNRAIHLVTRRFGSDLRDGVPYAFVYGKPAGEEHDSAKSVFALPRSGPHLFYLDAYHWRHGFDPPLALLPPEVRVGAEWSWAGEVTLDHDRKASSARLRIEALEEIRVPAGTWPSVRVRQIHDDPPLEITSWYARGVGLLRQDVVSGVAGQARRGLVLLDHTPARSEQR